MTFFEYTKDIAYGISIGMDYYENKYAWRAEIKNIEKKSIDDILYGNIYVDHFDIPEKKNDKKFYVDAPRMLSMKEFCKRLKYNIHDCAFYTGAGMAKAAGVWDLKELRSKLSLTNVNEFLSCINYNKDEMLQSIKEFSKQLYETNVTMSYIILKKLQDMHGIIIATENRDILHQKANCDVITREKLKFFPLQLLRKNLVVLGLSDDHSGLIDIYRKMNINKSIFIINNGEIPPYCKKNDYYLNADINRFLCEFIKAI